MRRADNSAIGNIIAEMIVNGFAQSGIAGHIEYHARFKRQTVHFLIGQHLMIAAGLFNKGFIARRSQANGAAFVTMLVDQKMTKAKAVLLDALVMMILRAL